MKKYFPLCLALGLAWSSPVVRGDDSAGPSPSPGTGELAPVAADWSMKPSCERPHVATILQRIFTPTAGFQEPGTANPLSTLDLESELISSPYNGSRKPGCDDDRVAHVVEVVAASLDASPDPDFGQSPPMVALETQRPPSVPANVSAPVAPPATAVCHIESPAGQSSVEPPLNPCTSPAPAADGAKFVAELPLTVGMSGTDDVIESQARKLTEEGLKLAAKGSTFSAQAKYIDALQLIAVSLDANHETESHAQDLASGLVALREADDFAAALIGASLAELDPATISVAHTTPLLKTATRSHVTRLKALQLYYSYATKKFVAACDGLPEASRALCCLGRLQPFLSEGLGRKATLTEPKALAFYQAAVMVDPKNFIAADELGVVLRSAGNSNPRGKPCCIVPLSAVGRKHFTISRSSIAGSATILTPNWRPEWPRKSASRRATAQPRRSRPRWSIGLTTGRSSHGRRRPTLSLRRRQTDRRTRRRHFRRALPSKVRQSRVNPPGPGSSICCFGIAFSVGPPPRADSPRRQTRLTILRNQTTRASGRDRNCRHRNNKEVRAHNPVWCRFPVIKLGGSACHQSRGIWARRILSSPSRGKSLRKANTSARHGCRMFPSTTSASMTAWNSSSD